ncbi:hypothetical protein F7D01_10160 [Erythrobacter sp. 3-20A1M]|uniref:FliM/FliN family flagellar motor switch protein n=1 Tax=Erythrobacter sp. 3-20A1M TaxID=2653850 RepID=UPI001BFC900A|nr:FliM/FliN family flagellar motor switch protein [Erythrobacter sp. 3-20A1M]QWC57401.1 hypothetical protein F7D01_10160 [Erythrobacter sp. 3-20A1M]
MARHCAELFRADSGKDADGEGFAQFGADLARALAPGLGALLGATKLRVSCAAPTVRPVAELTGGANAISTAATIVFPAVGAQIVSTLDAKTLIALTDRLFGGDGIDADGDEPVELPLMADLVATQFRTLLGDAMQRALPSLGKAQIADNSRHSAFDTLGADESCTVLEFTVVQPDAPDWLLGLALRSGEKSRFAVRRTHADPTARKRTSDPLSGALAETPFDLVAVVAETTLPLSRVSAFKPGDIVPLPIARQVPLRVGDRVIAHGSVGSVDDRVALRVSTLS